MNKSEQQLNEIRAIGKQIRDKSERQINKSERPINNQRKRKSIERNRNISGKCVEKFLRNC